MGNTCSMCSYCILHNGQYRCGRAEYGYMVISETDESCDLFDPFEEDEKESQQGLSYFAFRTFRYMKRKRFRLI